MQRLIGQLGSIGVAVLVTAAGLYFDLKTLTYAGVIILALVSALWFWSWGSAAQAAGSEPKPQLSHEQPPIGLSDKERALFLLKRARDNAAIAKKMRGNDAARKVYNELVAATLSVKRAFGFGQVTIKSNTGAVPWKHCLDIYAQYIDSVYDLLSEGHLDQAKAKPNVFTLTFDVG